MKHLKQRIEKIAATLSSRIPLLVVAGGLGLSACSLGDPVSTPATAQSREPMGAAATQKMPVLPEPRLQELSVREERGQTTLFLKFSKPLVQYRHFPLAQPARVVVDLPSEASPGSTSAELFQIDTSAVAVLRVNESESNVRIVIEVAAATVPPYNIAAEDGGLKIVVGSRDPNATGVKSVTLLKDGKRTELGAAGPACPSIGETRSVLSVPEAQPDSGKKYSGQKISLDFKDADIKNVFRLIGEVSGKNILVTDEVKQRLTVRLIEVPWDQALDLIIDTNGLAKEEVDRVIRISTATRLTQDRKSQLDARNAARSNEVPRIVYLNVNYAKAKELVDKVKQIVKTGADVVPDERSNTIVVRGNVREVQEVTCMVSRLDTRTPQVIIESNLIETNPTFARALGMQFQFTRGGTTFSSNFTPGSGTAAAGVAPIISVIQDRLGGLTDLTATLTAAENQGLVRVISRPSVATLNNVASTIQSLRVLRIALPASTNIASGSGSAAGTAVATERIPTGITLTVTPQVSSDGFILMNISVKSSSVAPTASPSSGVAAAGVVPFDEISREAIANVLVRDGETIVVGGILKDSSSTGEQGIPWVKDIPVLGWLFKSNTWQKDFEEMMVFITPRVAAAGSENLPTAETLWREQMKKTDGQPGNFPKQIR
jgi:type IV pilus assembly protein PilQ